MTPRTEGLLQAHTSVLTAILISTPPTHLQEHYKRFMNLVEFLLEQEKQLLPAAQSVGD